MSTHSITKQQIMQLSKDSLASKVKLKQWFPDLFVIEQPVLEQRANLVSSGVNISTNEWSGEGWYLGSFESSVSNSEILAYKKTEDQVVGVGFFDGTFGDDWTYQSISNFRKVDNEFVKPYLMSYFTRFTPENTIPIRGVGWGDRSMSRISEWSYHEDLLGGLSIYSMPEGHGGMLMYTNGQFATIDYSQIQF
jgi:hypothetical protein